MQASIFGAGPKPGLIGRVAAGRASGEKWGDDGGGSLISPGGVAPRQTVGVSASVIFPCTTKSRRSFLVALAHSGSPRKGAIKQLCVCDGRQWLENLTSISLALKHQLEP